MFDVPSNMVIQTEILKFTWNLTIRYHSPKLKQTTFLLIRQTQKKRNAWQITSLVMFVMFARLGEGKNQQQMKWRRNKRTKNISQNKIQPKFKMIWNVNI